MTLAAGVEPLRVLLIGGEPLGEKIVMWWNFVGRSHEEIVDYRAQWQAEIGVEERASRRDGIRGPSVRHVPRRRTCAAAGARAPQRPPPAPRLNRPTSAH